MIRVVVYVEEADINVRIEEHGIAGEADVHLRAAADRAIERALAAIYPHALSARKAADG